MDKRIEVEIVEVSEEKLNQIREDFLNLLTDAFMKWHEAEGHHKSEVE